MDCSDIVFFLESLAEYKEKYCNIISLDFTKLLLYYIQIEDREKTVSFLLKKCTENDYNLNEILDSEGK